MTMKITKAVNKKFWLENFLLTLQKFVLALIMQMGFNINEVVEYK